MSKSKLAVVPSAARTPAAVDLHVGARIRVLRKMQNVSQEKLADALNLTFQQVQKYERGANRVSASKLYDIAVYLRVKPGYFFEGLAEVADDGRPTSDPIQQLAMAPGGVELAQAYLACDSVRRRSIENVALVVKDTMGFDPADQLVAA